MIDQAAKAESAFRFHDLGLVVLPVHYPVAGHCSCRASWSCASPAKHPACSWKSVREQSEGELFAILGQYPRHNLGVSLIGSRVVVLDVDPSGGGDQALQDFEDRRGQALPETLRVRSGGGGLHLYFMLPAGTTFDGSLYWFLHGIDLRGQASTLVIPPSLNMTGRVYELVSGSPLATLPADVVRRVRRAKTKVQLARQPGHPTLHIPGRQERQAS